MTTTLGVALLLTAAATLYKAIVFSAQRQAAKPRRVRIEPGQERRPPAPATGRCRCCLVRLIGTLVTLTSVGAGAIGVTVLMLLYPACCRCRASSPPTLPTPCP
jgi:uncharacterized membrane protein YfcA